MSDNPPLGELADAQDDLDGCDIEFGDPVTDELELLQVILLGDTPPGTAEAEVKLAFYKAMADAAQD